MCGFLLRLSVPALEDRVTWRCPLAAKCVIREREIILRGFLVERSDVGNLTVSGILLAAPGFAVSIHRREHSACIVDGGEMSVC